MIIDIFKEPELWDSLVKYNQHFFDVAQNFYYGVPPLWKEKENGASEWFDPYKANTTPVGRNYPEPHFAGQKKCYKLVIYLSYYLPLFLINKLYNKNKEVAIEDFGAGDGKFFYYLYQLGFRNFHLIDNFSQMCQSLQESILQNIPHQLNVENYLPQVVINNGCYGFAQYITPKWRNSIELATCYTHEEWDKIRFIKEMSKKGYDLLCRDNDNLALAFSRNDKTEEFTAVLKEYDLT